MRPPLMLIVTLLLALLLLSCSAPTNPRVVLHKTGVEYAYPHFSADGQRILFQSNEHGPWQLCTIGLDGKELTFLTSDSMSCYFPDWSPDNTSIFFVSDATGNEEIYAMNSDGTGITQVTSNNARNIHPYFSPDGSTVLFSSTLDSGGNLEVYRMNPDGSALTRLTHTRDNESCARMSSDGSSVTFLRNNESGLDDLFLMSLGDSSQVNLTRTPTMDGWPCWVPDKNQIVYSAVENDAFKLFVYDVDSRTTTRLTDPSYPYSDCRANVSRDGRMIVFNRELRTEDQTTNALWVLAR